MTKITKITSLLLLVVLCVGMLASCGISSYEKRLTDAGYKVTVFSDEDIEKMNDASEDYEFKAKITAGKLSLSDGGTVTITQLASSKQAKAYAELFPVVEGVTQTVVKGSVVITGTPGSVDIALGN